MCTLLLPFLMPPRDECLLLLLSDLVAVKGALEDDRFEVREVVDWCALTLVVECVLRALSDRVARWTGLDCTSKGPPPFSQSRGGTTAPPLLPW